LIDFNNFFRMKTWVDERMIILAEKTGYYSIITTSPDND